MAGNCVFDCIHPWWGGGGSCIVSDAGDHMCVCDTGYASRDSRGNASCVPTRVLVATYLSLATVSVLAATLTVWNINQYRHLPVRTKSHRKTSIRMRALVSTSLYVTGFGPIGLVLAAGAGKIGYTDPGVLQTVYVMLLPSMVFGIATMAEYWVHCLPSQLISPGSFAGMLRKASETSNGFVLVGLTNGGPICILGVLTLFFEDWPQAVADVIVGAVTVGTIGVITFVAVQTTGVINQALAKGSARSETFYLKARKNLWRQAATLCGVASLAIAITLFKRLTSIGLDTPIIITTLQVLCGHAATAVFSSATRFEVPRSAELSSVRSRFEAPRSPVFSYVSRFKAPRPTAKDRHCTDGPCAEGPSLGEPRGATTSPVLGTAGAVREWSPAQRGRDTASTGRLDGSQWNGMLDDSPSEEADVAAFDVAVKSKPSGRDEATRPSRNAGAAARVVPVNDDRVARYTLDRISISDLSPGEWTVRSISDAGTAEETTTREVSS